MKETYIKIKPQDSQKKELDIISDNILDQKHISSSSSPHNFSPKHHSLLSSSLNWYIIIIIAVYSGTGAIQVPLVDYLRYCGATGPSSSSKVPSTMLPMLANTLGMSIAFPFNRIVKGAPLSRNFFSDLPIWEMLKPVSAAILLDFISGSLTMSGQLITGGAVFVILYSSVTAWAAIISRFTRGTKLGTQKWFAIILVTSGLMTNGIATKAWELNLDGHRLFLGSFLVLIGAALHSGMFVFSEHALSLGASNGLTPMLFCSLLGIFESFILLIYNVILLTIYGFEEVYLHHMHEKNSSILKVSLCYFLLILVNGAHAFSFFLMLSSRGAVNAALLKGVQVISVFIFSALFYCQFEPVQCATPLKVVSVFMVVMGLSFYHTDFTTGGSI